MKLVSVLVCFLCLPMVWGFSTNFTILFADVPSIVATSPPAPSPSPVSSAITISSGVDQNQDVNQLRFDINAYVVHVSLPCKQPDPLLAKDRCLIINGEEFDYDTCVGHMPNSLPGDLVYPPEVCIKGSRGVQDYNTFLTAQENFALKNQVAVLTPQTLPELSKSVNGIQQSMIGLYNSENLSKQAGDDQRNSLILGVLIFAGIVYVGWYTHQNNWENMAEPSAWRPKPVTEKPKRVSLFGLRRGGDDGN